MAYKSNLLSTLVAIRYNKPIDTLSDLVSSDLPLMLAKGSYTLHMFQSDQRQIMKQVYSRSVVFEHTQEIEAKVAHRWWFFYEIVTTQNYIIIFRVVENLAVDTLMHDEVEEEAAMDDAVEEEEAMPQAPGE